MRDAGAERVILAEAEDVLDGRCEKDCVGLPVDVFDTGPLSVGV